VGDLPLLLGSLAEFYLFRILHSALNDFQNFRRRLACGAYDKDTAKPPFVFEICFSECDFDIASGNRNRSLFLCRPIRRASSRSVRR
jgi:hypothetical protein